MVLYNNLALGYAVQMFKQLVYLNRHLNKKKNTECRGTSYNPKESKNGVVFSDVWNYGKEFKG